MKTPQPEDGNSKPPRRSTSRKSKREQQIAADTAKDQPTIRSLLDAVNSASSSARKSWVAFLALMAYLLVALAGVTHKDLLLNNPVELPFVRISIELDRFFIFAPIILLLIHFGFLLQHVILSHAANELNVRLSDAGEHLDGVRAFRLELHPYFYSQIIAGPWREDIVKLLLDVVVTTTFLVLPILLLLFFQISFLANHDERMTSLHQLFVLVDVAVVIFVGVILVRPRSSISRRPFWKQFAKVVVVAAIALVAPFFSLCVATLPDSWMDRQMRSFGAIMVPLWDERPAHLKSSITLDRTAFFLTAYLFEGAVNYLSGKSSSWFSRNLIVTDTALLRKTDGGAESNISLPGRDFRYATFDRSDFRRANLNGVNLTGAKLVGTDLREAKLSCAQKIGSFATQSGCANLRFTDFSNAQLQFADLSHAVLKDATFQSANLQGADLYFVDAEGANLSWSKLDGAKLSQAKFLGVSFAHSSLVGAELIGVDARGASFSHAQLQGAVLVWAQLQGADFQNAALQGANLGEAVADAADFRRSAIWTTAPPKSAALADTRNINLISLNVGDFESLMKNAESLDREGQKNLAREHLQILSPNNKGWDSARTQWNEAWKHLLANNKIHNEREYERVITDSLAQMACKDIADDAHLTRGLIRRASNSVTHSATNLEEILFNGDSELFYQRLAATQCQPARKASGKEMEQLRRIAELYGRIQRAR